ncbi:hypothetical protein BGW80DRAFT_1322249 [Lactifluus volemus]|nr:hypothetical protein BGW80DRAFT_1322249 [Lactifluus volemus]
MPSLTNTPSLPNRTRTLAVMIGVTFAENSALFRFQPSTGRPLLPEIMGRNQEGVLS